MPPRCPPALCQLTHGRVLADQQVRLKEVVDKERQPVHLACKSEDKSVSQVPVCQLHAFSKATDAECLGCSGHCLCPLPWPPSSRQRDPPRGHQLRVAIEPWSTVSCDEA